MKGKMYIIRPDGTGSSRELSAAPELEELQEAVEGYIELVPFFTVFRKEECVAFCNEQGKLEGLGFNESATELWAEAMKFQGFPLNDVIMGPIVIITGDDELMGAL